MKRHALPVGKALAGLGSTGAIGYLGLNEVSTGRHALWLYILFVAMVAAGGALYFWGQDSDDKEPGRLEKTSPKVERPRDAVHALQAAPEMPFVGDAPLRKVTSAPKVANTVDDLADSAAPLSTSPVPGKTAARAVWPFLARHLRLTATVLTILVVLAGIATAGLFIDDLLKKTPSVGSVSLRGTAEAYIPLWARNSCTGSIPTDLMPADFVCHDGAGNYVAYVDTGSAGPQGAYWWNPHMGGLPCSDEPTSGLNAEVFTSVGGAKGTVACIFSTDGVSSTATFTWAYRSTGYTVQATLMVALQQGRSSWLKAYQRWGLDSLAMLSPTIVT